MTGDRQMHESVDEMVDAVVVTEEGVLAEGVAAWLHLQAYQAFSSRITWSSV